MTLSFYFLKRVMTMACCASTSTRFVASSSCRARKTRTLSIHSPTSLNSRLWTGHAHSSARSNSLRRISSESHTSPRGHILAEPFKKLPATRTLCLEYLWRQSASLEDVQAQSTARKQLSVMMAFALCFLASATTTTSNHDGSSGSNPSAKFQGGGGGGGLGPHKTKPVFLFSKLKAEKDVQKVQEEAAKEPYLVSNCAAVLGNTYILHATNPSNFSHLRSLSL